MGRSDALGRISALISLRIEHEALAVATFQLDESIIAPSTFAPITVQVLLGLLRVEEDAG